MRPTLARDPESTRRTIGLVCYALGMLLGLALLVLLFALPPLFKRDPSVDIVSMLLGALFAMPMLVLYLFIPKFVDRYDPEPWKYLLATLAWGGIAACGMSALINTIVGGFAEAIGGPGFGDVVGACLSAPLVEEFWKGLAVFGMFYFLRREFDGVVDGVIYGAFVALGFAAVENVIYYANAAKAEMLQGQEGAFIGTFFVRGILAPWGHPLYTSMTGLGFGIARETTKGWLKWIAPIGGYFFAAFLHFVWNGAATISNALVLLMLPLWFLFLLAFFGVLIYLVRRKGKIIEDHLKDEVLMGNMTQQELALVGSPFAFWKATFSWGGSSGRKFVDASARLALSKWHSARATKSKQSTISADFVVPLRQELHKLRDEMSRALRRQLPQPQMWQAAPPPGHAPPQQGWAPQHGHHGGPPQGGYGGGGYGGGGYGGRGY